VAPAGRRVRFPKVPASAFLFGSNPQQSVLNFLKNKPKTRIHAHMGKTSILKQKKQKYIAEDTPPQTRNKTRPRIKWRTNARGVK